MTVDELKRRLARLNVDIRPAGRYARVAHPTLSGASVWTVDLESGMVCGVNASADRVVCEGVKADMAFDLEVWRSMMERVGREFGADPSALTCADVERLYRSRC